jgi:hypothetical protein
MNPTGSSFRRGVLAGLAGTVAYTAVSSVAKRRLAGARGSAQPAEVAAALAGRSADARDARLLNAALHWSYGAAGGVTRTLLERAGLRGWQMEVAHFAAVWLPWRLLVLAQRQKGHAGSTGATPLATDAVKHAVYVVAVGRAYEALGRWQRTG